MITLDTHGPRSVGFSFVAPLHPRPSFVTAPHPHLRDYPATMVSLDRPTNTFPPQTAVAALPFSIPQGQIVGFLGPNGAGKSTTLKMLTALLHPTADSAHTAGFDPLTHPLDVKRNV